MPSLSHTHLSEGSAKVKKTSWQIHLKGSVQGVGFRPFVYRLAKSLGLKGFVSNGPEGVLIHLEGIPGFPRTFLKLLRQDKPSLAVVESLTIQRVSNGGYPDFRIHESEDKGSKNTLILPDLATCPDCLRELFDPQDRRYRYPFLNCTHCGPRFSILESIPYDRPHTAMKSFALCPQCRDEYLDPEDRRFHAQPTACPLCGPQLELWDPNGKVLAHRQDALEAAENALREGAIVAVKGLGGFQLLCDARREKSVEELRSRKHREAKPFAVMFPDLESLRAACRTSPEEEELLLSVEAPIVLLEKKKDLALRLAASLSPANPNLGAFLPYSPLHHLLLKDLGFPLVATSGNLSDEPICTDNQEALQRLKGIADLFLVHNRPIVRPMDDSVARILLDEVQVLRRARGYAPRPIPLDSKGPTLLALGGFLKNTVVLARDDKAFLSQHLGDLGTLPSQEAFDRSITDLPSLYEAPPQAVVCDLHPDYPSTRRAGKMDPHPIPVQHHVAHFFSVLAENRVKGPAFGIAWDGTGLGQDYSLWGGEFFTFNGKGVERFGHFRSFPLVGGDKAAQEPRRAALGILYELFQDDLEHLHLPTLQAFSEAELSVLIRLLQFKDQVRTSSSGRLFDAVASLTGLCQKSRFEGEAAMRVEFASLDLPTDEAYPLPLRQEKEKILLDWEPLVRQVIEDQVRSEPAGLIAARFHNALVDGLVAAAKRAGLDQVALSGGCFQNRVLSERAITRLRAEGFQPFWQKQVPPNDGGLALGQAAYARFLFERS